MTTLVFTLIILIGAYFAGLLGSLTGLGGGFVIIPLLTLVLHVDIHYAIEGCFAGFSNCHLVGVGGGVL